MIYKLIKKIEDIIFSVAVLFIFLPILILIPIISLLSHGLPILYISKRMVTDSKEINIIKFRTMVKDAKSKKYNLEKKYMLNGYLDVPLDSDVYTPFGRFLEKTQLVEVPQVMHVLFGKISFIGNRPLPKKNVDILKDNFPDSWQLRFSSPCGITGITQVVGKFNLDAKQRLELESLYSQVYNNGNILKVDAYIFFSTIILVLLRHPSAYRSYNGAKQMLESCLNNK